MMRTMLSGANLSSDYWSHAIRHAVYIKNRLPHSALQGGITPFQAYTNRRPDLSHLRVFGSHVTVKQPRVRRTKLDEDHTTTGIFLGFTATNRNIWFEDSTTGELKNARHVIFDEAHYSADNRPPYAKKLMELAEEHLSNPTISSPPPSLPVHLLPNASSAHDSPTPLPSPAPHHSPHIIPTTDNDSDDDNRPPPLTQRRSSARIRQQSPTTTSNPTTPLNSTPHIIPDDDDASSSYIHTIADDFHLTSNPFGPSTTVTIPLKGSHPSPG